MPILIASAAIYSGFLLLWYKKILPAKNNQILLLFVSVALCTAAFMMSVAFNLYRSGFFIILAVAMLAFKLVFFSSTMQALYFSTFFVMSAYSSRGIIASLFSILQNDSINNIFKEPQYYSLIWLSAAILSILILIIRREVFSKETSIKQLFNCPDQMKFVIISRTILIIYMMLIDDGRYQDVPFIWFSSMYLLSCLMVKILIIFIENHAVRFSKLLDYELNTKQLTQQLSRQMGHYQAYKKSTEKFSAFQHDFKKMMNSVRTLINSYECDKALVLLDEIYKDLNRSAIVRNTYSDNIIVDAILQDMANICEQSQIRFGAMVHLPETLPVSNLELVRLISNVVNNAIEACCKIPVSERFIEINGSCFEGWISIDVINSYDGLVGYNGRLPPTSKEDKKSHGQGLTIVKQIVENNKGIMTIEANKNQRKFAVRFHLPESTVD